MNPTPVDPLNKKWMLWPAIGAGVLTVIAVPEVQTALIAAFTHPTAASIVTCAGAAAVAALLYLSHPYGTSK